MAYDEIDKGAKLDFKMFVTHKVGTRDSFNNAIVSSFVSFMLLAALLGRKLRRLLVE